MPIYAARLFDGYCTEEVWDAVDDPNGSWASFANSTYPALVAGVDSESKALNHTRRSLDTHRCVLLEETWDLTRSFF